MNGTTPHKTQNVIGIAEVSPEQSQQYCVILAYGTLKRGYWNHDRYCRNAIDIRAAMTWGRLYALSAGYPALEIPAEHILAHGTADPLADAALQVRIASEVASRPAQPRPTGDWDQIHGELIILPDPVRNLPPLDRLEGFSPWGPSFYQRVLTPVRVNCECYPAWIYIIQNPPGGLRLRHGQWGEQSVVN